MSITFKRHYRLVLALVLVVVLLVTLFPDTRIVAYTVAGDEISPEDVINYDNDVDLFDDTVVHEIVVLISEENQEKMVTTYQETGEKDYFPADVIIDGVRINNVGIRLKGNASLRSLGGRSGRGGFGGGRPGFGGGNRPAPPERGGENPFDGEGVPAPPWDGDGENPFEGKGIPAPPEGGENPHEGEGVPAPPEGGENPFAMGGHRGGMPTDGGMPMGGGMPTGGGGETGKVPYLIKLDEYVDGQRYQGYAKIALRTYGASYDAAQLQEPVSN